MAQIGNYKNLQYLSLKMNDLYEYKVGVFLRWEQLLGNWCFNIVKTLTIKFYANQQNFPNFKPNSNFQDQPVWIFGNAFFSNYCVYFDYEKNEIGIGQQILDPT